MGGRKLVNNATHLVEREREIDKRGRRDHIYIN